MDLVEAEENEAFHVAPPTADPGLRRHSGFAIRTSVKRSALPRGERLVHVPGLARFRLYADPARALHGGLRAGPRRRGSPQTGGRRGNRPPGLVSGSDWITGEARAHPDSR